MSLKAKALEKFVQKAGKAICNTIGYGAGAAFLYGDRLIDLGNYEERSNELINWYNDWEKNVGSRGRKMKYPLLSALGGLPSNLSGVIRESRGLMNPPKKTNRYL